MAFKNKRFLKLMLAGMISVQVVGCGMSANNNTEKNSEVVTESEIETEKVSEGTESEIDSEKDTQVSTNDSETEVSESEKVEENKEGNKDDSNKPSESTKPEEQKEPSKPTHTCNYATLKTDASNHWYACSCGKTANKGAHGYDDEYDASCNTCGYTRSVPERPVQPETPTGPGNVSWNGGDMNLGSIGITVPTLEDFNSVGLVPGTDNWWTGDAKNDKKALGDMNVIYMYTEEFSRALETQGVSPESVNGFTVSQGSIWWSWNNAGSEHFKLQRNRESGYYELIINMSLKDCPYGQYNLADWNKDIVKYLCTIVSSEPETLYNGIYEDLHGTAFVSESGWTTIGDCKVQFDKTSSSGHARYFIKAK